MSEPHSNTATESWKALVTRLPGVLGAEFTLENGTVREVHILSDQSRSPKQIVRDVQSAMLAKFQVELDHRIVSVAQIPGSAVHRPSRRLRCEQLELSTSREGASASVHLLADGKRYVGRAGCDLSVGGRWRAIAQATVSALNQLLAPGFVFSLDEVRRTAMGEHQAVLVGLLLKSGGKAEPLLGACYEGEDPNFSVALATLDAVNRLLSALPSPEEHEEIQTP